MQENKSGCFFSEHSVETKRKLDWYRSVVVWSTSDMDHRRRRRLYVALHSTDENHLHHQISK